MLKGKCFGILEPFQGNFCSGGGCVWISTGDLKNVIKNYLSICNFWRNYWFFQSAFSRGFHSYTINVLSENPGGILIFASLFSYFLYLFSYFLISACHNSAKKSGRALKFRHTPPLAVRKKTLFFRFLNFKFFQSQKVSSKISRSFFQTSDRGWNFDPILF